MTTLDRRRLLAAAAALAVPLVPSRDALAQADARPARPATPSPADRRYWPTRGWRQVAPIDAGLDPALFDEIDARLEAEVPSLSAFVVVYEGNLVHEHYANGFTALDVTDIWSSTKSVLSAAIGIAIGNGALTLESTVGEVIPGRIPEWADPGVAAITVEDLLRMCSGLLWDGTLDFANLDNTPDWTARTLGLPLVAEPGTAHTYNSGNSHVLSAMLQAATGQTLRAFSQGRIFTPIGVEITDWLESPQGETAGGWGLFISPREMLKFGYLMLNGGQWDGQQLVPADWVTESTRFQVKPIESDNFGRGYGYGYHWWLDEVDGIDAYFSQGYGESEIYVVPELDLVVAGAVAQVPPLDSPGLQARPKPIIRETLVPGIAARRSVGATGARRPPWAAAG